MSQLAGAIYFSFNFEDPNPGIGSWVFVTAFLAIDVVAAVFWSEEESLVFGAANVLGSGR